MSQIPRIKYIQPKYEYKLIVMFDNGLEKSYDCQQLMRRPDFFPLRNKAFFRSVKVDAGGYGISWNDDIDISEYELWTNGTPIPAEGMEHSA